MKFFKTFILLFTICFLVLGSSSCSLGFNDEEEINPEENNDSNNNSNDNTNNYNRKT